MSTSRTTSEKKSSRAAKQVAQLGEQQTMHIDAIKPYWRNPRKVPDEAINSVKESIETYGYLQPIVVDSDGVIIAGHTRYVAMRKLYWAEVPVRVANDLTPEQVKRLRVVDNRSAEYSTWDFDSLANELEELDSNLINALFPELGAGMDDAAVDDMLTAEDRASKVDETVTFICPSCFHEWDQDVTKDAVFSGRIGGDA